MPKEILREKANDPHSTHDEQNGVIQGFADSISNYLQDAQQTEVLRPHQREVFEDFQRFFQEGNTHGYIELPTGTGKTVLFVELSKALLSGPGGKKRPKILVVTPKKDLVHQTIGQTREKGYGRFAPELKVGSYFSDTPEKQRTQEAIDEADVIVTTYNSLRNLKRRKEIDTRERDYESEVDQRFKEIEAVYGREYAIYIAKQSHPETGRSLLDKFDVIILDEAHHTLGGETAEIIQRLPKDKVVLGFTATPDASDKKRLNRYLPKQIHSLELNEAIWLGLLAPIVPIGIKSGMVIRGSNIFNEEGDFIDSRIAYLAEDPNRNRLIVNAAKSLSEEGIGTIISCIAGNEAWHARHLAELLEAEGVRAKAVYSEIEAKHRQEIYAQFEKGEIDVLTFVGVLGEGWDSQRAKALIGARPTRSVIFSKQRLGRITRPGDIAYGIDIVDDFDDNNPPITIADVVNEGDISLGSIIGNTENNNIVQRVITSLKERVPVRSSLSSVYKSYEQLLTSLTHLDRGKLVEGQSEKERWAIATRITAAYGGVSEEILEKLEEITGVSIKRKLARQGNAIRTVYNIAEAKDALYSLPIVDPERYYVDEKGVKRISPQGLALLFSKRYPRVTAPVVKEILDKIDDDLDWVPVRYRANPQHTTHKSYSIVKSYTATQQMIDLLNNALSERFSSHTEK
jgi:superfamily II DNA or RNA helicase